MCKFKHDSMIVWCISALHILSSIGVIEYADFSVKIEIDFILIFKTGIPESKSLIKPELKSEFK